MVCHTVITCCGYIINLALIAGLSGHAKPLLAHYQDLLDNNPFAEDTLEASEGLMSAIAENRKTKWCNLAESRDMKVNSRRAWKLLKNLSRDTTKPTNGFTEVTADQVAQQFLLNGINPTTGRPMNHWCVTWWTKTTSSGNLSRSIN